MKHPLYLCLERDIKENESIPFSLFGHEILLTRNNAGKLIVTNNICPHKGIKFCSRKETNLKKCKYHGREIKYESSIKLSTSGEAIFVYNKIHLSRHELIMIGEEIFEQNTYVKAPYYLWAANTCDVEHVEHVHPNFSKAFNFVSEIYKRIFDGGSSHDIELSEPQEKALKFINKNAMSFFKHILYYPNLSITSMGDVFYTVENIIPIDHNNCLVNTRLFLAKGIKVSQISDEMLVGSVNRTKQILEEDKEIVEEWAKTFHKYHNFRNDSERIKAYFREIGVSNDT